MLCKTIAKSFRKAHFWFSTGRWDLLLLPLALSAQKGHSTSKTLLPLFYSTPRLQKQNVTAAGQGHVKDFSPCGSSWPAFRAMTKPGSYTKPSQNMPWASNRGIHPSGEPTEGLFRLAYSDIRCEPSVYHRHLWGLKATESRASGWKAFELRKTALLFLRHWVFMPSPCTKEADNDVNKKRSHSDWSEGIMWQASLISEVRCKQPPEDAQHLPRQNKYSFKYTLALRCTNSVAQRLRNRDVNQEGSGFNLTSATKSTCDLSWAPHSPSVIWGDGGRNKSKDRSYRVVEQWLQDNVCETQNTWKGYTNTKY